MYLPIIYIVLIIQEFTIYILVIVEARSNNIVSKNLDIITRAIYIIVSLVITA